VCNYMGVPWRVDICWDIENLLAPHNVTQLNLKEFSFDNFVDFKAFVGKFCTCVNKRNQNFSLALMLFPSNFEGVILLKSKNKNAQFLKYLTITN
jgi:hypothetical protein